MSKIIINRGSDLALTGTWKDATGVPINYTGWTISVYDEAKVLKDAITVVWTDASQGAYSLVMQWNDTMYSKMSFRLKVSSGASDVSSPAIVVYIQ